MGILRILDNIETETKGYSYNDYCIVFIGDADFETTNNPIELIHAMRQKLEKIKHTNVVLCFPTFKMGNYSNVFNWRVEAFNSLLYKDVEEHKHTFAIDSNLNLSYRYERYILPAQRAT